MQVRGGIVRVSLLHATHRRERGPLEVKAAWEERATAPQSVEHIFAMDADDAETIAATEGHLRVISPSLPGKVTAVRNWNAAAQIATGDLLFVIADDLFPPQDWDAKLGEIVRGLDPALTSFAVKVADFPGDRHHLLRHPVVSRKFFDEFGLFSNSYEGVYCDDDITTRAFWKAVIVDGRSLALDHRRGPIDRGTPSASQVRINSTDQHRRGRETFVKSWPRSKRTSAVRLLAPGRLHHATPPRIRLIQAGFRLRATTAYWLTRVVRYVELLLKPREFMRRAAKRFSPANRVQTPAGAFAPAPSTDGDDALVTQPTSSIALRADTHARLDAAEAPGSLDHVLHVARYQWLIQHFCHAGDLVIDLGCGTGYGVRMLQQAECRVIGVDLDPNVTSVQLDEPSDGARLLCADVTSPGLIDVIGEPRADVVASMETIEHLEDYFTFIENTIKLLRPGGTVVIGTPNRTMTYERYPGRRHMDPSHVQEFTPISLSATLENYFSSVELYFEHVPGYWPPTAADVTENAPAKGVPSAGRRLLRGFTPPVVSAVARRLRRRVAKQPQAATAPTYSERDVEISPAPVPGLEREAFALIAVCTAPRERPPGGVSRI
jgi:SAM-dependent methyltransferase